MEPFRVSLFFLFDKGDLENEWCERRGGGRIKKGKKIRDSGTFLLCDPSFASEMMCAYAMCVRFFFLAEANKKFGNTKDVLCNFFFFVSERIFLTKVVREKVSF